MIKLISVIVADVAATFAIGLAANHGYFSGIGSAMIANLVGLGLACTLENKRE